MLDSLRSHPIAPTAPTLVLLKYLTFPMTFKRLLKDSEPVELKPGLLCSSSEGGLLRISLLHTGAHLFTAHREGLTVGE